MGRLAMQGLWSFGWIFSHTFFLPPRPTMHCLGPGRIPCQTYVAHSSGPPRWTYQEGGLRPC